MVSKRALSFQKRPCSDVRRRSDEPPSDLHWTASDLRRRFVGAASARACPHWDADSRLQWGQQAQPDDDEANTHQDYIYR